VSERKLTKAEERRKRTFELLEVQMQEKGYQKVELKLDALKANLLGVAVALPFIVIEIVIYVILYGNPFMQNHNELLFFVAMFVGIVVHELIHGITWASFAEKGWKSIEFGIIWKYATPYCTCNEPMKKRPMLLAAIMPTIVLGLLPAVSAIVFAQSFLLLFSIIMIIGGGGDMLIIGNILKYHSKAGELLYLDHPYEVGTIVFEKNNA